MIHREGDSWPSCSPAQKYASLGSNSPLIFSFTVHISWPGLIASSFMHADSSPKYTLCVFVPSHLGQIAICLCSLMKSLASYKTHYVIQHQSNILLTHKLWIQAKWCYIWASLIRKKDRPVLLINFPSYL